MKSVHELTKRYIKRGLKPLAARTKAIELVAMQERKEQRKKRKESVNSSVKL